MAKQSFTGRRRERVTGFENPAALPVEVREEMESGKLDTIAGTLSEFLRAHEGSEEIYYIVKRGRISIQYHVVLLSNGDTRVNLAEVPAQEAVLGIPVRQ